VVIISDSSLWGVAEPYAKLIEQDRGVKAALHDEWQGGLSAGAILKALRGDSGGSFKRAQWSQLARDAEVLVIFGNPLDSVSPEMQSDLESCIMSQQPTGCTTEALAPYQADLEAIYDEIARLREGRPLILRATDIYNPLLSRWREKGIEDACRVCWESVNAAARQAAEGHRVPFVSVYDGFNGPDHEQDPRAKGLIRDDGEHPSEAGAQFIAELLQQSGYAYAGN
jgi:lysophospholipase L1-like esterase